MPPHRGISFMFLLLQWVSRQYSGQSLLSKNLEDADFGKVGSTERVTPAQSWWWMRRGKEIYAYLTRTESSAGYFLHWHSLTKGSTIERSWVGAGPGTFLPSSPTGNIAGWPLCPGRPASIHWERKMGRGEEKKKRKERGFYWLPTMCKPLARCCELGIQGPRDWWDPHRLPHCVATVGLI